MSNLRKKFVSFLRVLEGIHQTLKGLHWSTDNHSRHILCDEIDDAILEYEDKIAENAMGLLSTRIGVGELKTLLPNAKTLKDLLIELLNDIEDFRGIISGKVKGVEGVEHILDDFVEDVNKWKYLETLS